MPARETDGDESAMNLREGTNLKPIHRSACRGVLRTSPLRSSRKFTSKFSSYSSPTLTLHSCSLAILRPSS